MFHAARNERVGAAVVTRPDDLDEAEVALLDAIAALPAPADRGPGTPDRALAPGSSLTGRRLDVLLDAQLASRFLDHAARWLRAEGQGFYTIGSAGHEANALVAAALRPTDPALLHYRSGGFYLARAQQVPDHDGVGDILRGLLAASDEPIAGGRHKVFGHHDLAVIPQTSTIASHLPRALGVAFAIGHAGRLGVPIEWPGDAVAVCSFGDASLNHSTAQGALNAAAWMDHAGWPLPLLFVCEDNGWGISVPTLAGWVARSLAGRGLRYEYVDGTDPVAVFDATEELAEAARERGEPSILHLRTVRYGGHAGSDVEAAYRDPALVRADRAVDPVVAAAAVLVGAGLATPEELERRALAARAAVRAQAAALISSRRLASADEVMAPLAPRHPAAVADEAAALTVDEPDGTRLTLAESINRALGELLEADDRVLVFGEDVGVKGGVYGVTRGLQRAAGAEHVFDTLLDEQTILGLALGAAVSGYLPIPEIQYLAYVHNAIDQLRGEAATLSFFSQHRYRNGMVVRIAGYGYQKGFGGHFHNDNALGGLRDIPGVVVASPATGADAAAMLRTCAAAATVDGTVSVFLEPIALYHSATCTLPATTAGSPRPTTSTYPSARRASPATATTCWWCRGPTVCTSRCAPPSASPGRASAAGCSICAGWCRCRSPPSWPTPAPSVGSSSSTRRATPAGSARRSSPRSSRPGSPARSGASPRRTRSSRWATPPPSCSSPRTTSPTPSATSCADPPV